jgi:hypothetical protein
LSSQKADYNLPFGNCGSGVKRSRTENYFLSPAPQAAPQAAGFSAGLSEAPQAAPHAAGFSAGAAAPQAAGASAGLSEAPHAAPQAAEAAVSFFFQLNRFARPIVVSSYVLFGRLSPVCALNYSTLFYLNKYALFCNRLLKILTICNIITSNVAFKK